MHAIEINFLPLIELTVYLSVVCYLIKVGAKILV
jgi:hypothetical protein